MLAQWSAACPALLECLPVWRRACLCIDSCPDWRSACLHSGALPAQHWWSACLSGAVLACASTPVQTGGMLACTVERCLHSTGGALACLAQCLSAHQLLSRLVVTESGRLIVAAGASCPFSVWGSTAEECKHMGWLCSGRVLTISRHVGAPA